MLAAPAVLLGQSASVGCNGDSGTAKAARSGPCTDLAQQIAGLLGAPAVSRAHWGVMVTALDGTPIYGMNEGQFFQPASNAKLFTTAAAMALLGGSAAFETRVFANGTVSPDGKLNGELVLRGDGDANISGRELPYVSPALRPKRGPDAPLLPRPDALRTLGELADQVVASGVKSIDGDIVGDDTLFPWEPYPEDWSIDDMLWGYGAPVSALTVNDNQIVLTVAPGVLPKNPPAHLVGDTPAVITLDPTVPFYTVVSDVVTVGAHEKWSVGVDRAPGSRTLRIYGTIAEGAAPDVEEIAIDDPAEYAAMSLKQMLEARGVSVHGRAVPRHRLSTDTRSYIEQTRQTLGALNQAGAGLLPCLRCGVTSNPYPRGKVVAAHRSAPLAEDVTVTNKVSQNLHAELLLQQLSVAGSDDAMAGSRLQGVRVVRSFLTTKVGVDPEDFAFFDGSGLSGHDLVTPRATARLLQFATSQPWFADWKQSLPVGGEDSGLINRFPKAPLKDHVFAKTGTLGEARALSGYLDCASGRTVIFSIMVGNHAPRSNADRDAIDQVVAAIAAAN